MKVKIENQGDSDIRIVAAHNTINDTTLVAPVLLTAFHNAYLRRC